MLSLFLALFCIPWVQAALHHIFVGTVDGNSLYGLELDDQSRTLTLVHNSTAAGASPSLALARGKVYLFGTRPSDGTLSRYAVNANLSLIHEGTTNIPASCNTTAFKSIKLTSGIPSPGNTYDIYGSASTGNCSTLFSTSASGFHTLRSKEFAGDIRSLAWSPNGRHLHALDFQKNSIVNFNISDDPTLQDIVDTTLIANMTTGRQIITHPTGHRIYIVTQDTNKLVDVPVLDTDRVDASVVPTHNNILPKTTTGFYTSSVAISSSNNTLWTLSQNTTQAQVTIFQLDPVTGAVGKAIARAAFQNEGGGPEHGITSSLTPAPFPGDMVMVTTYPGAMVAILSLSGTRVTSYGRLLLTDLSCCGDGVWLD